MATPGAQATPEGALHAVSSAACENVVFILGIMPRCGTNFLHRLLCLHPACGGVHHTPVKEGYIINHTGRLEGFVRELRWHWGHWGDEPGLIESLACHLGAGLTTFLHTLTEAEHVVIKTPSVRNVNRIFDFFPKASLILIVRDGRSVVASGMEGFDWDLEEAARKWARAARTVRDFQQKHGPHASQRWMFVRYERLNEDPVSELKRVFEGLKLDADCYDFDGARDLPVYGSSFAKGESDNVSWEPISKGKQFSGNRRWEQWSSAQHQRFNWIAGEELDALGYTPVRQGRSKPAQVGFNVPRDLWYRATHEPARALRSVRSGVKTFLREMKRD